MIYVLVRSSKLFYSFPKQNFQNNIFLCLFFISLAGGGGGGGGGGGAKKLCHRLGL